MHVNDRQSTWPALVALGLLAFAAVPVSADGVVNAVFRIDSTFFKSAYTPALINQSEQTVAESLAGTAKSHFAFLDWKDTRNAQTGAPKLVLQMIDLTGGACDSPPAIKLQWAAVIESTEKPLTSIGQHDLYSTCDPDVPTQEPDRLVADVVAAAKSMLANEATRQQINDLVLKFVPIADALINHNNVMLLLPVHPNRLSADSDSELIATFGFARSNETPLPSDIVMRPRSGFGAAVQVLIFQINVPSLSPQLPANGALWDDALAEILAGSSDLKVYMVHYVPSPFAGETVGDTGVIADF